MNFDFSHDDKELIEDWFNHINAKEGTRRLYNIAISKYMQYHDMSLSDLLHEAEEDIVKGIIPRKRSIKGRIIDFRNSLEGKSDNTKHNYVSAVRSFFKSMDVQLPDNKRYEKTAILEENRFTGMERSEIKRVLKHTGVRGKAIILLIASSGTAAKELTKLTKDDFFNGLDRETGICTFFIRRKKTGGDYHTYCSPEASAAIQEYLNTRTDDLPWLFVAYIKEKNQTVQLTTNAVTGIFRRLSVKTGNEGEYGFFNKIRSHNFRKFFKTTMTEAGAPRWAAEWMMGHKEELDARYSSPSGEKMKNTYYLPYVNSLLIDTAEVIIQPKEDLDALRELQAEMRLMREKESEKDHTISELMKISLELKDRLDEEKEMADEEENRQKIMSQGGTGNKSVEETKEMWKNFEESDDPEFIKAKKEGEKSRKMSPKKLTMPTIPKQEV